MVHHCSEIIRLLSDYIDGEMDDGTRALLEQHLEDCPPCDEFLAQFKSSMKMVAALRNEKLPAEMKTRLHSFLAQKIVERE